MSEEEQTVNNTAEEIAPEPAPAPESGSATRRRDKSLSAPVRYGLSILILAGAALGAYGLSKLAKPTDSQKPTALVPKVALQQVESYAGTIDLLVAGTVVPHKEINVPAEVSGKVIKSTPNALPATL